MTLTEEDVKRIIAENTKPSNINPDVVQWLVRSSFEEGWRAAGGSQERSPHDQEPRGWRLAWMNSKARDVLVRNGMISGKDAWK